MAQAVKRTLEKRRWAGSSRHAGVPPSHPHPGSPGWVSRQITSETPANATYAWVICTYVINLHPLPSRHTDTLHLTQVAVCVPSLTPGSRQTPGRAWLLHHAPINPYSWWWPNPHSWRLIQVSLISKYASVNIKVLTRSLSMEGFFVLLAQFGLFPQNIKFIIIIRLSQSWNFSGKHPQPIHDQQLCIHILLTSWSMQLN